MWKYMLASLILLVSAKAEQKKERVWNQEEAIKKIEHVMAMEKKGQPWNDIKWNTDAAKVVAQSKKEGKPIFLYVYVSEGGQKGTNC